MTIYLDCQPSSVTINHKSFGSSYMLSAVIMPCTKQIGSAVFLIQLEIKGVHTRSLRLLNLFKLVQPYYSIHGLIAFIWRLIIILQWCRIIL